MAKHRRILVVEPSFEKGMGHYGVVAAQLAALWGRERTYYAVNVRWSGDPPLPVHSVLPFFTLSMDEASRARRYGRLGAAAIRALEQSSITRLMKRNRKELQGGWSPDWSCAGSDASFASSLHTRDLRRALANFRATQHDMIVVPSADAELALAVVEILEETDARSQPGISLRIMFDDINHRPTDLTLASVLQRLARVPDNTRRVRLFTESQALASMAEDLLHRQISVLPHLTSILRDYREPARTNSDRFVIIAPGQSNPEKGAKYIGPVIEEFATRFPTLAARTTLRTQTHIPVERLVATEVLAQHLDPLAYARALRESGVALLLHDPKAYALRSSGVVCDAVAARLPIVCRAGSSLAEWITDGNGIAAADLTSIVTALAIIADDPSVFRAGSDRAVARLAAALSPPILGVDD
jgi:hypothetical protein